MVDVPFNPQNIVPLLVSDHVVHDPSLMMSSDATPPSVDLSLFGSKHIQAQTHDVRMVPIQQVVDQVTG